MNSLHYFKDLPPVVTPNCVTRATRDWLPRLSIPRANFISVFREQVSAYTKVLSVYQVSEFKARGAIHFGPEGPSFLASWDKRWTLFVLQSHRKPDHPPVLSRRTVP